jgi:hypothetical protein
MVLDAPARQQNFYSAGYREHAVLCVIKLMSLRQSPKDIYWQSKWLVCAFGMKASGAPPCD